MNCDVIFFRKKSYWNLKTGWNVAFKSSEFELLSLENAFLVQMYSVSTKGTCNPTLAKISGICVEFIVLFIYIWALIQIPLF